MSHRSHRLAKVEEKLNYEERVFKWIELLRRADSLEYYLRASLEATAESPTTGLITWLGDKFASARSAEGRRVLNDDFILRASRMSFGMNCVIELNLRAEQILESSAGRIETARIILELAENFPAPRSYSHKKTQPSDVAEHLSYCGDLLREAVVEVGSIEVAEKFFSRQRFQGRKLLNEIVARGLETCGAEGRRLVKVHDASVSRFNQKQSRVSAPPRRLAKIDVAELKNLTDNRGAAIVNVLEAFVHANLQLSLGDIEGAKKTASGYLRVGEPASLLK